MIPRGSDSVPIYIQIMVKVHIDPGPTPPFRDCHLRTLHASQWQGRSAVPSGRCDLVQIRPRFGANDVLRVRIRDARNQTF
eukprot:6214202-Pleurochrysis_carterae.AAC.1